MLPVKVNCKHKNTFPTVRNNYKKYKCAKWKWINILNEIDVIDDAHAISVIAKKYNINPKTLRNKYNKWILNNRDINITDNRGGHNKIFTAEQEKSLYEYIKEVFIDNDLYFDDSCLKILANKLWTMTNKNIDNTFKASKGWIYYFKLKWRLSTRTASYCRKSVINNIAELDEFKIKCDLIKASMDKKYIFNLDETFWRIVNGNIKVMGMMNTDNRKLITNMSPKSGYTAVFIISADGIFYKPYIIMKGKTKRCLTKTGLDDDNLANRYYSASGWINERIMKNILKDINMIANGEKSVLILDKYYVHTHPNVVEEGKRLNIEFVFVPTGKTSTNQPLDVCINGPMKSIGKRIAKETYLSDPFAEHTIKTSIAGMLESKNSIKSETIKKSFKKACNF